MKLNQNVLSPYNNFLKVDASELEIKARITVNNTDQESEIQKEEYKVLAEKLLDSYLRYSVMPSNSYVAQLQYLDRKIEATRKTISSWESYRIGAVAENEDELRQKLGTLAPNTGLVVNSLNTAQITVQNKTYSRGDIVFKDINNQEHLIRSYSGGYYYPTSIRNFTTTMEMQALDDNELHTFVVPNGTYQLEYYYATSIPEATSIGVLSEDRLNGPAATIYAPQANADSTGISYGRSEVLAPGEHSSIPLIPCADGFLQPVVSWMLSETGERIYFDNEYVIDQDQNIQTTNSTSLSLKVEVR